MHQSGDSHVSPAIRATGRWEPFATRILWSLFGPGDGVVDIGGNIGWYAAVLGRAVGPNGWVHTFEPDPVNLALLRKNVEGLELTHVSVHPTALAGHQGTMQLELSAANLGDHRLAPNKTIPASSSGNSSQGSVSGGGPSSMVPTDGNRLRRLAAKLAPHGEEWAVDLLVVPDVQTDQRRLLRYRVPRPLRWV